MRASIDGERKAIFRRVSPSMFRYEGLVPRSIWSTLRPETGMTVATQRVTMGMALHVQACEGQYPTVGTLFPAALFAHRSGLKRSGRSMDAHLSAISAQRKAERQYASILQGAKKVIL